MQEPSSDQYNEPVVIALGGTGVIGQSLARVAARRGLGYRSLSLSPNATENLATNVCVDLSTVTAEQITSILEQPEFRAPLLGILDIIGLRGTAAEAIANFAVRRNAPVAVISSCLLYDHEGNQAVDEDAASFTAASAPHSYHRNKLLVEHFWRKQSLDWRILRTNHVLGKGSLLGCIPAHNRDPMLLLRLKSGETLALARRGDLRLSYIHPEDLAQVALDLLLSRALPSQIINVVHPSPVRALDYYAMIATQLGVDMVGPTDFQVDPMNFWSATARDNVYRSHFPEVSGISFHHDIQTCIRDALTVDPSVYAGLGQFMWSRISG
jgi:nucleoside-diphosphate-sugar epimerase